MNLDKELVGSGIKFQGMKIYKPWWREAKDYQNSYYTLKFCGDVYGIAEDSDTGKEIQIVIEDSGWLEFIPNKD